MNEILKYQDIDMKIKKLEGEIMLSDERKNATNMQNYLRDCQSKICELNEKCESTHKTYTDLKKVYGDMVSKLQSISSSIDTASGKKLEGISELIQGITSNLSKLDREIAIVAKQVSTLSNEYENIMKNARTAKKNLETYKEGYLKIKDKKEPEIIALKKELALQEKKVDKVLLAKYLAKHNEKSLPVFVCETNGRCDGCRMEIAGRNMSKLRADKYLECENCGRIIFVE